MTASAWYGLMLPAKTPLEIVEKLNNEINSILQKQEIKLKFEEMGAEIIGGTSSEFSKFARTEIVRYEKIVRESGAPSE